MCLQQQVGFLEAVATILNCLGFRYQTKILEGILMLDNIPLFPIIFSLHSIRLQGDQGQIPKFFE